MKDDAPEGNLCMLPTLMMLCLQGTKDSNHFHFADDIPSHVIVSGTLPFVSLPNFKAKKERRQSAAIHSELKLVILVYIWDSSGYH